MNYVKAAKTPEVELESLQREICAPMTGGRLYDRYSLRKGIRPQADGRESSYRVKIWFVLAMSRGWKDVPTEMGYCGETARIRLQAWERPPLELLESTVVEPVESREATAGVDAIMDTT